MKIFSEFETVGLPTADTAHHSREKFFAAQQAAQAPQSSVEQDVVGKSTQV